jgi:hypothetical protein
MASEDPAYRKDNGRPESFISNETTDVSQRPILRKPIPGAEDRDSHENKPFIDVNISNSPDGTVDPDVTKEVHSSTEYSNSGKCGLACPLSISRYRAPAARALYHWPSQPDKLTT